MRIAYLTAGAGGMYCGSCMQDNTLARALIDLGVDVQLIPLYMPIRTDQPPVTIDRVFFSGISVYLRQAVPLARYVPGWASWLLERPRLLRWIGTRQIETSPRKLGALTVSMLRGQLGPQRAEVQRLAHWLRRQPPVDLVVLTNALIAGCVPALRQLLGVPVVVMLQGDDLFLDGLTEPFRQQALDELSRLAGQITAFLAHTDFYAAKMANYLGLPRARVQRVPLGIDTQGFPAPAERPAQSPAGPLRLGYLARLAPEKGLHFLVDAFLQLKQQPSMETLQLDVAGWLGAGERPYAEAQFARLRQAGLQDAFRYRGVVGHEEKLAMLGGLDVFSVPTDYEEPKGIYVLEAMAAGVPVVQPDHGAFPELLRSTGGGRTVPPRDPTALARALQELLGDAAARHRLGQAGQQAVHRDHTATAAARQTRDVLSRIAADAGTDR